jgi:hypothetical protein
MCVFIWSSAAKNEYLRAKDKKTRRNSMKKFLATFCAGAMAVTAIAASATSAGASPFQMRAPTVTNDVVDVQYRRDNRRDARRGFYRQGNYHYYNGHRGHRERRAGYRQHNGFWFPPAAFIAGAIIGGAIASPPAVRPASNAHVQWCYNRYRSYRASDNTFQPYSGPRQLCHSPYR